MDVSRPNTTGAKRLEAPTEGGGDIYQIRTPSTIDTGGYSKGVLLLPFATVAFNNQNLPLLLSVLLLPSSRSASLFFL